jgi:hypothetical protein
MERERQKETDEEELKQRICESFFVNVRNYCVELEIVEIL